jgi:hypothetical protein
MLLSFGISQIQQYVVGCLVVVTSSTALLCTSIVCHLIGGHASTNYISPHCCSARFHWCKSIISSAKGMSSHQSSALWKIGKEARAGIPGRTTTGKREQDKFKQSSNSYMRCTNPYFQAFQLSVRSSLMINVQFPLHIFSSHTLTKIPDFLQILTISLLLLLLKLLVKSLLSMIRPTLALGNNSV